MPVKRFPILLWQDATGLITACSVQHGISAAAKNRSSAIDQLKAFYEWRLKSRPWEVSADILEARLTHFSVSVRPEYRDADNRVYITEAVTLNVPCVHGKLDSGMLFASVPTMQVWFNYTPDEKLKDAVVHYVQQALRDQSPAHVLRYLPPESIELEDIIVPTPPESQRKASFRLKILPDICEAIGTREFRAGLSRPFGRENDVDALAGRLLREKHSLLVVGGSGSGKTAVIVEAARRVERSSDELLQRIFGKAGITPDESRRDLPRFWITNGGRLIAGMKYLGQWEERVEAMIAELEEIGGILCIESLLGLIRTAGRTPGQSVAAFLVPYLQRGELRLIAETTPEELDACRRLLPAIVDCCQLVRLEPMNRENAIIALEKTGAAAGQNTKITLGPAAVHLVYRLFSRFMPYQEFPGAAAAFVTTLFDAAARQKINNIREPQVLNAFVRRTGLPEWLLRDDRPLDRSQVLQHFQAQIIGQDAACHAVTDVVTTFKAALNDPGRPLGALLFAGPTGVGKTELARALGRYLFGQGDRQDPLVRLDMSEYSAPGAGERLLMRADGETSDFITRLRQQPFCVVLLDEIEKAAPEIFDVLLGMLDEGRLTDSFGRLTSFRSAVIIMTSNIGAEKGEPFGLAMHPPAFASEVEAFFRPEFVNRLDRIVTFAPLSLQSVRQIVIKELSELPSREGLARRKLRLRFTDKAVDFICKLGFDKRYGARPLQRTIEQHVVTPLSRHLLRRPAKAGAEIVVDLSSNALVFE